VAIRKVGQIKQDLTLKEAWEWAEKYPSPEAALTDLIWCQQFVRTCVTEHEFPEPFYSIIEERETKEIEL
jgi:hypothetical protein